MLIWLTGPTGFLNAQQIRVEPAIPLASDAATIYFDAKECDCPLSNYNGAVYAHTGILKGSTIWQNVIGTWGDNNVQPALRPLGNRVYALDIKPSIAEFYNETEASEIMRMAFVFRSSDGSQQTADLFVDVFQTGELRIVSPGEDQIFNPGDSIHFSAVALGADSMFLNVNGQRILSASGGTLEYRMVPVEGGRSVAEFQALVNGRLISRSSFFFIRKANVIAPLPDEFRHYGVNPIPEENAALFVLPAPGKSFVYITGDFNDWAIDEGLQMNVSEDQKIFWIRIDGLDPEEEYGYQYIIDGKIKLADPYARKVLDPWNDGFIPGDIYPDLKSYPDGKTTDLVSTFRLNEEPYEWKTGSSYTPPASADLQIYELLIREFTEEHSYRAVMDSLDYLQSLGINAIELMPVMEFEGNSSWGYNTSFHFALDKYYGMPNDFKALIDECHARGIAVILDIVINHAYGQNPLVRMYWDEERSRPAEDNPWFNTVSPNQVFSFGYDFDHESTYTTEYFKDVLVYWLEEYKVDGYRLDFTKGLTNRPGDGGNYDASRIRILKNFADHVWSEFPDAYMILEHFAPANEEVELTDHGMLVWGNHNHNFNQIAMGYASGSNFSWSSYKERGMQDPGVITYMESHDEERMMFKVKTWGNQAGEYDTRMLATGTERAKMAALLWLTVPGPKLLWMFGELGFDISIDDPCRICEKPVRWEYLEDPLRAGLKSHYADLLKLRLEEDIFSTDDFSINASPVVKWVHLRNPDVEVLSVANTGVQAQRAEITVSGDLSWTDFFTGKVVRSSNGILVLDLEPGEYLLLTTRPFREVNPGDWEITISSSLNQGQLTVRSLLPLRNLKVFDLSGREVFGKDPIGANEYTLDLTGVLPAGIYILLCEDERGHKKTFKWAVNP